MRKMTIRLVVAMLAFGVGVSASALWTLFSTVQVPAPTMKTSVIGTTGGGCFTRVIVDAPPPPMPPSSPGGKIITAGVLNGKAISKPAPAYPPIAKAARASGTVTVQIVVDEGGKVISASAVG
ncbi:MAG TPA: TonB family protein, partial [Pyrinomonadaceae bacterium]|nr:TonB family protein [Pyrinomonadaceae bacterium]